MNTKPLLAPFPYFGGKSKVANIIWDALGDVKYYTEPFCGSCAVLLQRPNYDFTRHVETINDRDGMVCNAWRAIKHAPDKVSYWCDNPPSLIDLAARQNLLISEESNLVKKLIDDPMYFDAQLAGYWVWGMSCFIGCGLMFEKLKYKNNKLPRRLEIAGTGRGICKISMREVGRLQEWFSVLSQRLRYINVICGDWKQACYDYADKPTISVGFFIDPPYGVSDRCSRLYRHDDLSITQEVLEWCKEKGNRKSYRVVVAGYEEYMELVDKHGWSKYNWTPNGGYGNRKKTGDNVNKLRETLYFSPNCCKSLHTKYLSENVTM